MHLIIASILMVATLSAANAEDNAPQAGYILGGAHSEFGVSSHMLYVTYPGVDDTSSSFIIECKEKDQDSYEVIHTFNLDTQEKAEKSYTYFFALKETKEGNYTVKFCNANNVCSKPSSPPTIIDDGQGKLDCKEIDTEVKDIAIPEITNYATNEDLEKYKLLMKEKSIAVKHDITQIPSFKNTGDNKGFMYFMVKYKLSAFKKFFTVPETKDEDKYCQRKYTFMVVTQVFNGNTKQVLARGRFTPRTLTDEQIKEYITNDKPKDISIEFKLDVSKELAQRSDLQTWHSVCISAKDMVSSRETGFAVKCSDPFENDWTPVTDA